jgi:hypothetical protein
MPRHLLPDLILSLQASADNEVFWLGFVIDAVSSNVNNQGLEEQEQESQLNSPRPLAAFFFVQGIAHISQLSALIELQLDTDIGSKVSFLPLLQLLQLRQLQVRDKLDLTERDALRKGGVNVKII